MQNNRKRPNGGFLLASKLTHPFLTNQTLWTQPQADRHTDVRSFHDSAKTIISFHDNFFESSLLSDKKHNTTPIVVGTRKLQLFHVWSRYDYMKAWTRRSRWYRKRLRFPPFLGFSLREAHAKWAEYARNRRNNIPYPLIYIIKNANAKGKKFDCGFET